MKEVDVGKTGTRYCGRMDDKTKCSTTSKTNTWYDWVYKCVPEDWKRADTAIVDKGENREDLLKYKPVPLTSAVCKLYEEVLERDG